MNFQKGFQTLSAFSWATVLLLGGCASPQEDLLATRVLTPEGRIVLLSDGRPARQVGSAPSPSTQIAAPVDYWWQDDGSGGPPRIVIHLGKQRAFFYRGQKLVGETPISSGREGYNTPEGSFRVTQKNRDHVSNLYGDYVDAAGNVIVPNVGVRRDPRPPGTRFRGAPMPYFMRIHGAVGLHAGYLPGYPASHGCIRLPMEMARKFFHAAPLGTTVIVQR